MKGQPGESWSFGTSLRNSEGYDAFSRLTLTSDRPLRGAHRQFVVDLSVFCRRGLCPPLGIAGRSRLLQDCPAGATFPGAVPEKRRPLRGAHRQFVVDLSVFCRRGLCPPLGIAGRSRLLQDCPAGATFPGAVPEKRRFYLCNFSAPCAHRVDEPRSWRAASFRDTGPKLAGDPFRGLLAALDALGHADSVISVAGERQTGVRGDR